MGETERQRCVYLNYNSKTIFYMEYQMKFENIFLNSTLSRMGIDAILQLRCLTKAISSDEISFIRFIIVNLQLNR